MRENGRKTGKTVAKEEKNLNFKPKNSWLTSWETKGSKESITNHSRG